VSLGGVHRLAAPLELHLHVKVSPSAVNRPALMSFAVRSHYSSSGSKLAFTPAYHLTTG
jgi:hypothetical protein